MRSCIGRNLRALKKVMDNKNVFNIDLKDTVFRCILEILFNICNRGKKEEKLISRKLMVKLRLKKKELRYLFNLKKSLIKRKQRFVDGNASFKKLITKVLAEFFRKCVVD